MENVWEEMQQHSAKEKGGDGKAKSSSPPKMGFRISRDHMQAFFYIQLPHDWDDERDAAYVLKADDVVAFLKKHHVDHGIQMDAITNYCEERLFGEEVLVAEGTPAVPGIDGTYELHVDTDVSSRPKEMENGLVDYHQLDLIRNVMAGDVLCTIKHPTLGEDGIDVHNKPVKARPGIPAPIRAGKNVTMITNEEGTETMLAAETDGRVELKMGCLVIETIYLIIGDVGPKTGHIDFKGSVKVMGNVLEGFNITAEQDVHISGRVEGCLIHAGGNVVIEDGVAGMDKAIISVKGNFTSRFLENATVICGGDVNCDIALRSFLKVKGGIYMDGQRGALVGGECLSGTEIVARTLGSQRNLAQNVAVLPNWDKLPDCREDFLEEEEKVDMEESLQILTTLKERLNDCNLDLEETRLMVVNGDFKGISRMKKLMDMKQQLEVQINEVRYQMLHGKISTEAKKNEVKSQKKGEKKQAKISCRGTVYPGVRIFVEHQALAITDEKQFCFFISDKDSVYVGTL